MDILQLLTNPLIHAIVAIGMGSLSVFAFSKAVCSCKDE